MDDTVFSFISRAADVVLVFVAIKSILIGSGFDFVQFIRFRGKYVKAYDEWLAKAPRLE